MAHRILVLSLVMALLLVTVVAPAAAAPRQARQALAPGMSVWSVQTGSLQVGLPGGLRPNGGCEDGAASGCPNPK